jgi:tetratricopeptide (TPR) repeat protein
MSEKRDDGDGPLLPEDTIATSEGERMDPTLRTPPRVDATDPSLARGDPTDPSPPSVRGDPTLPSAVPTVADGGLEQDPFSDLDLPDLGLLSDDAAVEATRVDRTPVCAEDPLEATAVDAEDEVEATAVDAEEEVEPPAVDAEEEVEGLAVEAEEEVEPTAVDAEDEVEALEVGPEDEVEAMEVDAEEEGGFTWENRVRDLELCLQMAGDVGERVELLLDLGEINLEHLDDRTAAARAYEEALQLDPRSARAIDALDRIRRAEGRTEDLIELLINQTEKLELPQDQAVLLHRVAQLYERLDEPEKAVITLEAARKADPHNAEIAAHLEELTRPPEPTQPKDQVELLLFQLEQVRTDSERLEIYERLASTYQQRGEAARAAACLEQVLTLDPRRQACLRQLEQHYGQTADVKALVSTLERHVEVASPQERAGLYQQLARLYEDPLGDTIKAREAYRHLLAVDPENGRALQAIARLSELLEDWPAVVVAIEEQARRDENPATRAEQLYRLSSILLEQLGENEAAEARLVEAAEVAPAHARTVARLTEIYRARGDWGKVVKLMLRAESNSVSPLERAHLLYEAGLAAQEGLDDEERAIELFQRTLEVDPDHAAAALPLSELYWRRGRHEENLPVLEVLLRKTDPADIETLRTVHHRLGVAADALGREEQAVKHYQQATRLDPAFVPALRGMATLAFRGGRWRDALSYFARVLDQRALLDTAGLADALHGMGVCCRELGDREQAIQWMQQVLEVDRSRTAVVDELAALHQEASNWEAAVQLKTEQLESAEEERRFDLLREIAEIHRRHHNRPDLAEQALKDALALRPDHHGILHELIELYSETERWPETIRSCARMAELESDAKLRAKYHFTIAVIYRDRIDDADQALEYFNRVLDDDPEQLSAFEAIDALCTRRRAWKQLEQSYGRMIKRLPQEGQTPLKIMLWHNLGEILRSRRRDFEGAAAAFEVAARLDPENLERRRILTELYVSLGAKYVPQAIAAHHELLLQEPDRLELYHTLRKLYMESGDYDRAWCICMALALLKHADREEQGFFQQYRRQRIRQAKVALAEELWRRHVHHADQHPYINAIFAILTPVLAATTARPPAHYGLKSKELRGAAHEELPCVRIFDYVTAVLMVARANLYLRPDRPEGLLMAHTQEVPSFVAGGPLLQCTSEKELAFVIGKQLAYLRPEHFLRNALPTKGQLQTVLLAAMKLFQPDLPLPDAHARIVGPIVERIQRTLQPGPLEQLAQLVHRFSAGDPLQNEVNITRWWNAIDLTSDRVGFILCNDLELAASMISADSSGSELSPAERVRHLVQYATSESYLTLRGRLALTIGE